MNAQFIIAKLKQYPIAVGGVLVILLLAIGVFLRKSKVPELEGELVKIENQWGAISANNKESASLPEHVKEISAFGEEIQSRLIVREDKAINQQYFYGLEEKTGITLTLLSQSDTPPPPRPPPGKPTLTLYSPIEFSVGVAGNFQQVLEFLYRLEHGQYFSRIDGFSTNSIGLDNEDQIQISLKMDMLGRK